MNEFKQCKKKFLSECFIIFLFISFMTFFIDYLLVFNIKKINGIEILASVFMGIGFSLIYGVVFNMFYNDKKLIVKDNSIIIKNNKKYNVLSFNKIYSVNIEKNIFLNLFKTVRLKFELDNKILYFYLEKKLLSDFINFIPKNLYSTNKEFNNNIKISNFKKNIINILTFNFYFLVLALFLLPGILNLINSDDIQKLFKIIAYLYFFITIVILLKDIIVFLKYFNYNISLNEENINIKYGKFIKNEVLINKNSISTVYKKNSFVAKLFGLSKIELITYGNNNDIVETNYFPFYFSNIDANKIINCIIKNKTKDISFKNSTVLESLPEIILTLLPIIFIVAVSIISSWFFMLNLIPVIVLSFVKLKHKSIYYNDEILVIKSCLLSETIKLIPIDKIIKVDLVSDTTAKFFKLYSLDITLKGYKTIISTGYYKEKEFDYLLEILMN